MADLVEFFHHFWNDKRLVRVFGFKLQKLRRVTFGGFQIEVPRFKNSNEFVFFETIPTFPSRVGKEIFATQTPFGSLDETQAILE